MCVKPAMFGSILLFVVMAIGVSGCAQTNVSTTLASTSPANPASTYTTANIISVPTGMTMPKTTTTIPTTTTPITSTIAPTTSAPGTPSNVVTISNYAFIPGVITVPAGSRVTWVNKDGDLHTVTCVNPSIFDSPIASGGTITIVFSVPGSYDYICTIHPEMFGTVIVK